MGTTTKDMWIDVTLKSVGGETWCSLGSGNLAAAVAIFVRHSGGEMIDQNGEFLIFDPNVNYLCENSGVWDYQTEYQSLVNKILTETGKRCG